MNGAVAPRQGIIPGLQPNLGHCPEAARGHRVRVILRNGSDTANTDPNGWPADGNRGVRWTLTGGPFDIMEWELLQ